MKTYIIKTRYNSYKYYRRVPTILGQCTTIQNFRVALGTNQARATQQALLINASIDEALQMCYLQIPQDLIMDKIKNFLPKTSQAIQKTGYLNDCVEKYIESNKDNISKEETSAKLDFYNKICQALFKKIVGSSNPYIKDMSYENLLEFKSLVIQLPRRSIQKYRVMEVQGILNSLDKVANDERLSPRTVNKYIKWLRALFNFCVVLNYIQINYATSLPLQKTEDEKLQRLPLNDEEIELLLGAIPLSMRYLLQVISYTGMRLSEVYKCSVETIDGVLCFSLLNRDIKLKTKSSYRFIPVHSSLLFDIGKFESLRQAVSKYTLSRATSVTIKELGFKDKEKKSLYSFRHRFATVLIQKGADSSIVSELMGHAHSTMTLSRYSSGYSAKQLQQVVEML